MPGWSPQARKGGGFYLCFLAQSQDSCPERGFASMSESGGVPDRGANQESVGHENLKVHGFHISVWMPIGSCLTAT